MKEKTFYNFYILVFLKTCNRLSYDIEVLKSWQQEIIEIIDKTKILYAVKIRAEIRTITIIKC